MKCSQYFVNVRSSPKARLPKKLFIAKANLLAIRFASPSVIEGYKPPQS